MKDLKITKVTKASASEWDSAAHADYSTYFHTREWAEIFAEYDTKLTIDSRKITFSDNKTVIIPLVYRKTSKGLVKSYISSPAGTFGGWISEDELSSDHAKLLVDYMISLGKLTWRENPYDPNLSKLRIPDANEDFTQALDLKQGFDVIYKKWTKGHVSAANKARREGVTILQAESLDDWRGYYEIYQDSLRRWGDRASSSYDWLLFEIIFNRNSKHIKLWLAKYKDTVISGALCFYNNRHVVHWHGASHEKYFGLRSSNLLQYEIIKDACQNNYLWYDFNPSGGHKGVIAFKNSFGAHKYLSRVMRLESNRGNILAKALNLIKG